MNTSQSFGLACRSETQTRQAGRIYFDGTVLCQNRSGELFSARHMVSVLREHFHLVVFLPSDYRDRVDWLREHHNLAHDELLFLPITRRRMLIRTILGLRMPGLSINEGDVLIVPNTRVLKRARPQVCVCHDLIAVSGSRSYRLLDRLHSRIHFQHVKQSAFTIICHSGFVKDEIMRVGRIVPDRILLVPLGFEASGSGTSLPIRPTSRSLPTEILYLSGFHKRKNFMQLVSHFRKYVRDTGHAVRLTVAGPGVLKNLTTENDDIVRCLDYISESERDRLFRAAQIYVNPSAAEGFGITNLEAQMYGLAVLCNDIPVFRETLGESAAYFDIENYESFRTSLHGVITDHDLRSAMIARGYRKAASRRTYTENLRQILIPWMYEHFGGRLASPKCTAR